MGVKIAIIIFSLIILSTRSAFANVYINEFSSSSDPDWIELYNSGPSEIDLSLYRLRDESATNKIDLEGILAPDSFIIFDWSNKLNNPGDTIKIVLKTDEENIQDQISYGTKNDNLQAPAENQTAGRKTNGNSEWVIFTQNSKGLSNIESPILPSPTSTPTPTSKPTPTVKPPKTPTPNQSFTTGDSIEIVPSLSSKPSISPKIISLNNKDIPSPILGVSDSAKEKTKANKREKVLIESASKNNIRFAALGIGIIALACAILFFIKIKNKNANYE